MKNWKLSTEFIFQDAKREWKFVWSYLHKFYEQVVLNMI